MVKVTPVRNQTDQHFEYEVRFKHKEVVYNVTLTLGLTCNLGRAFDLVDTRVKVNYDRLAALVFNDSGVEPSDKLYRKVRIALEDTVPPVFTLA